jgi:hypothetical protein
MFSFLSSLNIWVLLQNREKSDILKCQGVDLANSGLRIFLQLLPWQVSIVIVAIQNITLL